MYAIQGGVSPTNRNPTQLKEIMYVETRKNSELTHQLMFYTLKRYRLEITYIYDLYNNNQQCTQLIGYSAH